MCGFIELFSCTHLVHKQKLKKKILILHVSLKIKNKIILLPRGTMMCTHNSAVYKAMFETSGDRRKQSFPVTFILTLLFHIFIKH